MSHLIKGRLSFMVIDSVPVTHWGVMSHMPRDDMYSFETYRPAMSYEHQRRYWVLVNGYPYKYKRFVSI